MFKNTKTYNFEELCEYAKAPKLAKTLKNVCWYEQMVMEVYKKNGISSSANIGLRLTKDGKISLVDFNCNIYYVDEDNLEFYLYEPESRKVFNTKGAVVTTILAGPIFGAAIGLFGKNSKVSKALALKVKDEQGNDKVLFFNTMMEGILTNKINMMKEFRDNSDIRVKENKLSNYRLSFKIVKGE